MPSINLDFQDDNKSDDDNDIIAVIRKCQRSYPKIGQPSVPTNDSSNRTLAISSETPFTKAISQIGKGWNSFIVGNFLQHISTTTTAAPTTLLPTVHAKSSRPPCPDGPIHGDGRVSTDTTRIHKRPLLTEGDIETEDCFHARTSSPSGSTTKRRMIDRHHHRASGSSRRRRSPDKTVFDVPSDVLSRETYKAIKHTPITAEAKARERVHDIKHGKGKGSTGLSAAKTNDHDELFKVFAAKQTSQQRNQVAHGLLVAPERQREATDTFYTANNRNTSPIKRKVPQQTARASIPEPKVGPPRAEPLPRPRPRPPAERAPKPRPETPPPPPPPPREPVSMSLTPVQTIPAQDFLDTERLVTQWVVYRTPRFCSDKFDKHQRKIRCTTHLSKRAANEAAHARHERIRKGVVRKSWSMTGYDKGLFESIVEYTSDGDGGKEANVIHFWVEEETRDLAKISEKWQENGKTLHLDQARASIYARKRYDVWSVMIYPAAGMGGQNQGQMLMVECGGDGDEDDDRNDVPEGEDDDSSKTDGDQTSVASPGSSTQTSQTLLGSSSFSSLASGPSHHNSHGPTSPVINPFTYISTPKLQPHGSYTTPRVANEAALATILDLAKPKNARIEDHHFYKHHLVPELTNQFWEAQTRGGGPDVPVTIQWDATEVEGASGISCIWRCRLWRVSWREWLILEVLPLMEDPLLFARHLFMAGLLLLLTWRTRMKVR
ncbi:hypothetical protein V8F33_007720 [Rhypophila sp. PSN 637]